MSDFICQGQRDGLIGPLTLSDAEMVAWEDYSHLARKTARMLALGRFEDARDYARATMSMNAEWEQVIRQLRPERFTPNSDSGAIA